MKVDETIEVEDDLSQMTTISHITEFEHEESIRTRSPSKFITDHHHPINDETSRIFGCTYGKLWFSLVFSFFFMITFLPILYSVVAINQNIYKIQSIPVFLIMLDFFIVLALAIVWALCIGNLKRKHEEVEYFETILFMIFGFLTALDNSINGLVFIRQDQTSSTILAFSRVFSVSFQCAFISHFENHYLVKGHSKKLLLFEVTSILMAFYNIFIFMIECAIDFNSLHENPISTITLAAALHFRLDSFIYFAHFSYGSSLENEVYYEKPAAYFLNLGSFSNEIISLTNGRHSMRGGFAGIGKALSYVILGGYTCLKIIKYFALDEMAPSLRSLIVQSVAAFDIFIHIFVGFGFLFAGLSSWKTLKHVIDKTDSQTMWKFYIRLACYGLIFLVYYSIITVYQLYHKLYINAAITGTGAAEGIVEIIFLLWFHSRKSAVITSSSAFWILSLWFFALYNIVFALMDVVEEYAHPHHFFPVLDSFGIGLSVAFKFQCANMCLNLANAGVWVADKPKK